MEQVQTLRADYLVYLGLQKISNLEQDCCNSGSESKSTEKDQTETRFQCKRSEIKSSPTSKTAALLNTGYLPQAEVKMK